MATYMIKLQWQAFNVSLPAIEDELRAQYPSYVGNQAHSVLELHFNADPSIAPENGQSPQALIEAWWAAMTSSSAEATAYQSAAQIESAAATAKASALSKLQALGLTSAEIAALVG